MSTQPTDSVIVPAVIMPTIESVLPPEVTRTDVRLGVSQYLAEVFEFTSEIFGGISRAFVSVDPEIPDDTHIIFEVRVGGSIDEALDKDEAWGERLLATIPRAPRVYALSLDFRP